MTKVIVVDDDPSTVKVFVEFLKVKKIDVIGTGINGRDAVALYKELKPDVVLLDVMMPQYDGFYAIEKIREIDEKAKIIAVTADLTAETEKKLQEMNVTAITYKPYEIDTVVETIEKVNNGQMIELSSKHDTSG